MTFPMGILCLFIGGTLMWVAAHGTSATSPWTLFQQIIAGWNGQAATAAPAAGDAQPDGAAIDAGDAADSSGGSKGAPSNQQLSNLRASTGAGSILGVTGAGLATIGATETQLGQDPFAGTGLDQ